jgi:hypothetical protein
MATFVLWYGITERAIVDNGEIEQNII